MTELPASNLPYLFAAFAVVWVVFFIYAAYMSWRRQSAQRELEELRASARGESDAPGRDVPGSDAPESDANGGDVDERDPV